MADESKPKLSGIEKLTARYEKKKAKYESQAAKKAERETKSTTDKTAKTAEKTAKKEKQSAYKKEISTWKSSKPQREKKEKKGKASSGATTAQFQGKKAETIKKRIGHLRAKAESAAASKKGIMTGGRDRRVAKFEKRIEKKTAQLGKAVGKYEAKQAKKAPSSSVPA